ncbi:hypothetical protein HU200_065198 [Digitaria exilis]|uniref:Uncharacterized protein n=1 Tax=Digitaria exilis TaxID=1010633 RepID=A0A835A0E5_9POAL|nr:hypothetical protein HU200_065198 [Digitaria exilis]
MEFATGALGTLLPKLGQLLSEPVKIWANQARELSYDMEDIVDTFLVRIQGPDPLRKKGYKRFFKKMSDMVTKAKTQHEIGKDINDIKERVKEVAARRQRYKLEDITPAKTTALDPRIASLYTKVADLVGIDEAREELISRLTKVDEAREELITRLAKGAAPSAQKRIVSVVGFGGLGKTTLAKVVYDKLKGEFDCTAFVPVGRSPDLKKVFKDILINLNKQQYMSFNFSILDERQLINEFHEFLDKKRYFIVIDDVWETQCWETIKLALVDNNSGSRIIITTRNHEVAREAGQVYELQPLSDDNSRKLFFARIFADESKSSGHQPDDVSDEILRKCGGIPLAIITMASLLVGKPREEWPEVHRSIGYSSKRNRQVDNTMKILSFSYYDLPPHLRTCLLHLSMFPEDYFIEKGPLIWMCIAEGFVQEKQGISSFETGEGYFNELVNRSMIQLVQEYIREWPNLVCGYQVHDMVLDLIRSISYKNNEGALSSSSSTTTTTTQGKVRRLALQNINRTVKKANMDMQQVRSFISSECYINKRGIPFISNLRLFFCESHSTDAAAYIYACILTPTNIRTQPYPYEHLRKTGPANPPN